MEEVEQGGTVCPPPALITTSSSQRSPGSSCSAQKTEGWREAPTPAPHTPVLLLSCPDLFPLLLLLLLLLLLQLQGLCSSLPGPGPPSLETGLIWDCYKNNNNPNAEKPRKGPRAALPPPLPSPFQTEYKTAPKADILYRGGGWGASGMVAPGLLCTSPRWLRPQKCPWGPCRGAGERAPR